MTAEEIIAAIAPAVPGATYEALVSADAAVTPTVSVPREQLVATCRALQAPGLEFVAFSDVTAVDFHPNRLPRFDLVYHFVSPHRRARVRLKVRLNAQEAIETLSTLYPGAGWPERELDDLFGIVFDHHPDLRRLMMPEDWEGHPLRKDYPVQLRKDAQTYMPLQVTEEEFKANMERDRFQRGIREAAVTMADEARVGADLSAGASAKAEALAKAAAHVVRTLKEAAAAHERMAADAAAVVAAAGAIAAALKQGRTVFVFGNGGSAADAQHFAAELVGRYEKDRKAWPAVALTTDTSALTAIANDYGFERVFARQIEALGRAGDIAIGISTSGTSPNVLRGIEAANGRGMISIALTGRGGEAGKLATHHVAVKEERTARVQEVHATVLHAICELVEMELKD